MGTPAHSPSQQSMILLSRLLLEPRNNHSATTDLKTELSKLDHDEFEDLLQLAHSNHVVVRGLEALIKIIGKDQDVARVEWAERALAQERARIHTAMTFLHEICEAFEKNKYDVTVIKSLDHWPDLGSDLDLYTNTNPEDVSRLMRSRFNAQIAERSWGDRLASKWNFLIPGLSEAVEIHMRRLGQTGEQVTFATSLVKRARRVLISGYALPITSISDRLMISSMQRMYRHFYFRLCDVIDTAALSDAGAIDFEELRALSGSASIWKGMATYLVIVSDYVKSYRGSGLRSAAVRRGFSADLGAMKSTTGEDFCASRSCPNPPGSTDRNWQMCWAEVNCTAAPGSVFCRGSRPPLRSGTNSPEATREFGRGRLKFRFAKWEIRESECFSWNSTVVNQERRCRIFVPAKCYGRAPIGFF